MTICGSLWRPEIILRLLDSPSISDISLSDVGSHFTLFNWEVFFFGVFSWITGNSILPSSLFDGVNVFFSPGFVSPGSTIPNSYPKSYLKYIKPVSGSMCFVPALSIKINLLKKHYYKCTIKLLVINWN